MKKVGIVGLGIMGHGMADNFVKKDYEAYVWNRHADKAGDLVRNGAKLCQTPKEVAEKADIIFEVTANDETSKRMWTAKDGILAGSSKDKVLICSATISIDWVDELARICEQKGFTFFDMPLTGSRIGAETGRLTMLVGGDEAELEKVKPVLAAISEKVLYFGPHGQGIRYKLLLNVLQAIHIIGFGEVMKIAEKNGMDVQKVAEGMADRPGGVVTGIARNTYHNQPESTTFAIEWITKDLDYAKKFAGTVNTPLLDGVLAEYRAALDAGKGQTDWTNINEG